ncbi:LuxR C-terminal-related transcriptional regulator [Streptomyces sp. NBC_01643]|uniref:helix-turn-helix transcriptional regulator n=1 Tax=Streptomyces sp. NBC_01643 TaxID=2975906 RepID=UPI0038691662|nr:LuxR family transcriptional regulator [Streptomyces sp. NBC_01643]
MSHPDSGRSGNEDSPVTQNIEPDALTRKRMAPTVNDAWRTGSPNLGLLPTDKVPLIGRDAEMTRLARLLTQSDQHGGVLLVGPSGVGKTRLATDTLAALAVTHRVVRIMATWPGQDLPYGSLSPTRLPRAGQGPVDLPATELLGALRQVGSSRTSTLLFMDDVHLLDPATAALVLELARQRVARLLVTLNAESPSTGAVTALWKDDHLRRMELGPLDAAATRRLATAMLGAPLARGAASWLARLSDGNPLLLRELARAASEQDLFRHSPAGWTLTDRVPLSVPLRELIARNVGHLDLAARDALELVVLAEPAPLPVLDELVPPEVLLGLETQELIRVDTMSSEVTSARLFHPLIGHVIRHSLPALRRRSHLRAWVSAYTSWSAGSAVDTLRVTGWRLDANDPVSESELLEAARYATDAHDLLSASRFTAAAWQHHPNTRTACAHALALIAVADFDSAIAVVDAAEAADGFPSQDLLAVRAREALLQGHFRRAEQIIAHLTGSQGRLFAGMASYLQGKFDRTLRLCGPLSDDHGEEHQLEAAIFQMAALLHAGRPNDALTLYEQVTLDRKSNSSAFHADSLDEMYAATLADLGRLAEAIDLLSCAYDRAITDRRIRIDAQRGLALGIVLFERGRPRQALDLFSLHPSYQVGWQQWHDRARVWATAATALLGRASEPALPPATDSFFLISHRIAQAWVAYLGGDRDRAAELLLLAAGTGRAQGAHADVALAVHEMARLGLAECARPYWDAPVQGFYLQARLDYARALATADIKLMRRTADAFTRAGAEVYAAEAYAEMAQMYRRVAQVRAATAAALQAKALASRCEGARTPALLLLDSVEILSPRERELVLLVSQGLSDKEIAERLTLSVRTVGNHFYRIYRKLGVANRRELQRAAFSVSQDSQL